MAHNCQWSSQDVVVKGHVAGDRYVPSKIMVIDNLQMTVLLIKTTFSMYKGQIHLFHLQVLNLITISSLHLWNHTNVLLQLINTIWNIFMKLSLFIFKTQTNTVSLCKSASLSCVEKHLENASWYTISLLTIGTLLFHCRYEIYPHLNQAWETLARTAHSAVSTSLIL